MNNKERNSCSNNCMADILKVILILQQSADGNDSCLIEYEKSNIEIIKKWENN